MESLEELEKKRSFLVKNTRSRLIELDFHPFRMGYLEAVLARADRRSSAAVHGAWKAGSRFDGWADRFNFGLWMESFKNAGLDPDFYASRNRPQEEALPWDFIDIRT
jgi:hypothetical protein